jgi:ankyrin repeat protein
MTVVNEEQVRFNPRISAAIRSRDLGALKELLAAEPGQVRAFTPFAGGTWLHYAAHEGDLDAVQLLLSLGLDVNVGDARDGRKAICDASSGGREEVARELLEAGSKLDTSEPVRNPLFAAIQGKSLPIVRMLLSRGIDSEARYTGPSMKSMDAVAFALERGEVEIAKEIAKWNAKGDEKFAAQILERARKVAASNNVELQ